MTYHEGELLVVYQDGRVASIPNQYEAMKEATDDMTLDAVGLPDEDIFFVDDNGIINAETLNVPASLMAGMVLFGPAILAGGADDDGDTMLPSPGAKKALRAISAMWFAVCQDAARKGQRILPTAQPDTLPPAQILSFVSDEAFMRYVAGESQPGDLIDPETNEPVNPDDVA